MMKRFFTAMLGSLAAIWISVGLIMILAVLFITALVVRSNGGISAPAEIEKNSVLHIDLATSVVEREGGNNFESVILQQESNTVVLADLLNAIRKAADDSKIEGIYLTGGGLSAGQAALNDIADALREFKKSGKWIVAYADNYTQGDYILSSGADELYVNPVGMVDVHGLSATVTFYKGLLDKLGVDVQVIKVGTFKSAVEPYVLTSISDANREQMEQFLSGIWGNFADYMAEGRDKKVEDINNWADSMLLAADPVTYVQNGVVDSLFYKHQVTERLVSLTGVDEEDDLKMVEIPAYIAHLEAKNLKLDKKGRHVAVLYAVGEISESGNSGIASNSLVPQINDLADDDDVAALVLRVNSPGGSAFASEQIWEALQQFKAKGKPFYVSMGDYAASGGYYISCGADRIYASPVTLTGSIGIFGLIPNAKKLLNDHLGITESTVKTNLTGNFPTVTEPMTEYERSCMQGYVNRGYETFVGRCAEGRDMPVDSIKAIAEGRVWDGMTALKLNLVDELGSLDDAVAAIAKKVGLHPGQFRCYPDAEPGIWDILAKARGNIKAKVVRSYLGDNYELIERVNSISEMSTLQTRMPDITLH